MNHFVSQHYPTRTQRLFEISSVHLQNCGAIEKRIFSVIAVENAPIVVGVGRIDEFDVAQVENAREDAQNVPPFCGIDTDDVHRLNGALVLLRVVDAIQLKA